MGATKPSLFRQGIYSQLTAFSESIAKERGFKYLVSEATSPGTQAIQIKRGYKVLKEQFYKDMIFPDGTSLDPEKMRHLFDG